MKSIVKNCEVCSTEFIAKAKHVKWCSVECRRTGFNRERLKQYKILVKECEIIRQQREARLLAESKPPDRYLPVYYGAAPNGVLHVDRYRIYGKWTNHKATLVPVEFYEQNTSILEEGPCQIGPFSFRLCELEHWDLNSLRKLGPLVGWHQQICISHESLVEKIRFRVMEHLARNVPKSS